MQIFALHPKEGFPVGCSKFGRGKIYKWPPLDSRLKFAGQKARNYQSLISSYFGLFTFVRRCKISPICKFQILSAKKKKFLVDFKPIIIFV